MEEKSRDKSENMILIISNSLEGGKVDLFVLNSLCEVMNPLTCKYLLPSSCQRIHAETLASGNKPAS